MQQPNYTYFSSPTNAFGSILLILFSYSVSISKVSRPWKAFSCKLLTLLWFIFKIRSWFKFLNAADGTWVKLFWDTSSCVNTFPAKKYYRNQNISATSINNELRMKYLQLILLPYKIVQIVKTPNVRQIKELGTIWELIIN